MFVDFLVQLKFLVKNFDCSVKAEQTYFDGRVRNEFLIPLVFISNEKFSSDSVLSFFVVSAS